MVGHDKHIAAFTRLDNQRVLFLNRRCFVRYLKRKRERTILGRSSRDSPVVAQRKSIGECTLGNLKRHSSFGIVDNDIAVIGLTNDSCFESLGLHHQYIGIQHRVHIIIAYKRKREVHPIENRRTVSMMPRYIYFITIGRHGYAPGYLVLVGVIGSNGLFKLYQFPSFTVIFSKIAIMTFESIFLGFTTGIHIYGSSTLRAVAVYITGYIHIVVLVDKQRLGLVTASTAQVHAVQIGSRR